MKGENRDMLLDAELVGMEGLAVGIILQACKDYRKARRKLTHRRKNRKAERMIRDCEDFFRSEWFEMLSKMDGRRLLEQLRQENE